MTNGAERKPEEWPHAPIQYKNGSNRIMWGVAIGATSLLASILLLFLGWVGVTLWNLTDRISALESTITTLAEQIE